MRSAPVVVIVMCMAASPGFGQELLENPGLEAGPTEGIPDGWKRYGGGVPESQATISAEAHSGERAVRLLDTGPNERKQEWSIGLCQTIEVGPREMYVASVWAKCAARNHEQAIALQLTFKPSGKVFNRRLTPEIGGDWKQFLVFGEAGAGDTSVVLYVYSMHFWTCDFLVDDISLRTLNKEEFGDRLPLGQYGGLGIDEARALNLRTPIVVDGAPAADIAIPSGGEWRGAGEALQAAIKERTGVELPLVDDADTLMETERTIIAIGDMNSNFIIERLHWNKYLQADALTPGAGKYVLRTVHQPFNFKPRVNVLTVEAGDPAGAEAGVKALLEALPEGQEIALDAPLLVNPNHKAMDEQRRAALLDRPLSRDPWTEFWKNAEAYRDLGDIAYAEKAKRVLFQIADMYRENPGYHMTWPEETSSNRVGAAWDVLEECAIFTDAERLRAANTILTFCYSLPRHVSGWARQSTNDTITWNHTTFPILGIYWIARHFERWHGDVDAKIENMMAAVRGCFRGQKKSWKPQCDADSYLTIVPRHLMEYTLAENDYEWFESGHCRKYAEYLTALSDNRGARPGLGDSGYSTAVGYELSGLPMALWYYKDGRYLWRLQQVKSGKWENPFDQAIRPTKWYSMEGLTVTRLHEENYNFTKTRSYYSEPVEPPNVPFEKAFDKITFRENLEPGGEFLLLDGYSRGKHLHYDGNAIIKFNADGEDWLIDGDYLVRNTTEHTMVSVIRDGRCDKLMPVCASVEHFGDLGDAAFTQTVVYDYNGADWTRYIAWVKGEFFLVIDECLARENADYTFEAVWKTLDRGEQTLDEGRIFRTRIESLGGTGSRGIVAVRDPTPDVPTAVRFSKATAQLDFALELPQGEYSAELHAYGLDTGTDSLWFSVDGGAPVGCHVPIGEFGSSSRDHTKTQPTPNVRIATDGAHLFSITLRENPGVMLDRVVIRDAEGETVADFQAEDAPRLPEGMIEVPPDARFFIKSDGTARSKLSTRVSHVGLPIRKLHQRFGGKMRVGDRVSAISIFYNDAADAPKEYDVRRIGPRTALILKGGAPFGMFTADPTELALPLDTKLDAAMIMMTGPKAYMVDVSRIAGAQEGWLDDPVCVEADLDKKRAVVHARRDTIAHLPDGTEYQVWEGESGFDISALGDNAAVSALRALPSVLALKIVRPTAGAQTDEADVGFTRAWQQEPVEQDGDIAPVTKLLAADLDGDGADEIIVLRGRTAVCLDQSGQARWEFEAGAGLRAVAVADLEKDGEVEVLVGGDDERFYILDSAGNELARHHMQTPLRVGRSSVRQPRVSSICVGDIDLDGVNEIIIGTKNGNIARFDLDLNRLWAFDSIEHGTRDMMLIDLEGDERLEIVAENKYGAVEVVDEKGNGRAGVYSELGDVEMAVGDLDGDGKIDIANGSSTGAFVCQTYRGARLFEFPNHGYGVMDVRMLALKPDEPLRVVIASETGYVYALDAEGKTVAQRDLGDAALELAALNEEGIGQVLVGCRDGYVYGLDGDLSIARRIDCGWPVDRLAVARKDGKPSQVVVAGAGNVAGLAPDRTD